MQRSRVLAIIPARGGSKGLPQKNIRLLAGKPLIVHTIDVALGSCLLDRTVVSTDDRQIADIARRHGADVPFLRPPELARDDTTIYPVLIHAIEWLARNDKYHPDYVMVLQPTSPLRTREDIDNSIKLALEKDADAVVSLCETKQHPYWIKRVTDDGLVVSFMPLGEGTYHRRQELPPAYVLNGSIYLARPKLLLDGESFFSIRSYAYVMPHERSVDIDTLWDFRLAELILRDGVEHERG